MKELSFKDSAAIIRKYAGEYHKSKIIELSGAKMEDTIIKEECLKYIDSENKYTYYLSIQNKIDLILDMLDWEESFILKNEFFSYNHKSNWWLNYYSRSTYYRLMKKSMNNFLSLLYA